MNIGEEASLYLLLFFIQDGNYRSFGNLSRNDDSCFFFFEESRNKVFLQLLTIVKHSEKMNHIFTFIEYIWMKYGIFGVEIRDEQGNGNFSNYS